MSTLILGQANRVAGALDRVRAEVLRWTMEVPALRTAFTVRSLRLSTLFALSFAFSLLTSLYFPLWVLALGPAVYGVPHIFTSIRYFHFTVSDRGQNQGVLQDESRGRLVFAMLAFLLACVASYRLFVNIHLFGVSVPALSEWRGSTYLEFGALLLAFAASAAIYRKSLGRVARGLLILSPLIAGFWYQPWWTIGAMVLIHNFVAFYFWALSTHRMSERIVAIGAGLLVFGVTVLIFAGRLDSWLGVFNPEETLGFAKLGYADLGAMITPWSEDPIVWRHAAIAYAFGQAMHYFVWLKAIPDQQHYHEIPTSFRQSLRLLELDFGKVGTLLAIGVTLGSVLVWLFVQFPMARMIYFALAAFHGYLEVAGLALSSFPRLRRGSVLARSSSALVV